jgi:hypothetical protein
MLLALVLVRHYKRSLNWLRPVEARLLKRRTLERKQRGVDDLWSLWYSIRVVERPLGRSGNVRVFLLGKVRKVKGEWAPERRYLTCLIYR